MIDGTCITEAEYNSRAHTSASTASFTLSPFSHVMELVQLIFEKMKRWFVLNCYWQMRPIVLSTCFFLIVSRVVLCCQFTTLLRHILSPFSCVLFFWGGGVFSWTGLKFDDLMMEEDPDVAEAVRRLTPAQQLARKRRQLRAFDISLKKTPLPDHIQAVQQPFEV